MLKQGVIWSVAPDFQTLESLHKVLETLKEELKFLLVMSREQVLKDYVEDLRFNFSM